LGTGYPITYLLIYQFSTEISERVSCPQLTVPQLTIRLTLFVLIDTFFLAYIRDRRISMNRIFGIILLTNIILSAPLYSVTITSPKTGDTWYTGYDQTITWDSRRDPHERVKIYLLSPETSETVETWDLGEDKGSFRWNLLRSFHPGQYKIRIRIGTEYAESGPFEIKESFIRVTYPTEMIKAIGPSTVQVMWESSEEMETVRITKIYNGQEMGSDVIDNLHYYDFVIDKLMHGAWRLKIANGNTFNHFAYSETIWIDQPSLTVQSPSAGKSYRLGETIGIRWEASNFDKFVRVELWDRNEEHLLGIIKDETDAGRYSWETFTLEGKSPDFDLHASFLIKVVALNIPDLSARSSIFILRAPLMDEIIELYRPAQGDRWVMGKTQAIDWHVRDDRFAEEDMEIQLYRDETLIETIGKAKIKERNLSWNVPNGLAEGSHYRIKMELPRFPISTLSKYFIIHGDYCFSNKVKVHSIKLDEDSYLFNEDIEMRVELENPSADRISGTLRLYIQQDQDELGNYLGEMEIEMAPQSKIELSPILIKAEMLFNSPGKYSQIFQPKIIPKNLPFLTCDCIGKSFVIDASRQIPCGVELIDFTVDKAKYNENEKLEYTFTLFNRSEHPFQGDVVVSGSSGFKEAEFYKGTSIKLGMDQRKQITGSIPVKDIVDMEGRYELKLKGEFFSSDAIVESGTDEIRRGPKIEVLPQLGEHDLQRVDLAIERCRFIGKSEFQGGEKGKVYVVVRNNGNAVQKEFQVAVWNAAGEPQKTTGLVVIRPQVRGSVSLKKPYRRSLQPGKTYTDTLEITFREKKSGTYTLYIEVTPLDPKNDSKPKDNQVPLPYKYKAIFQIKK